MDAFSLSEVFSSLLLFAGIVLALLFANILLKAFHINTSRRRLIIAFFAVIVSSVIFIGFYYMGWAHSWKAAHLLLASMCWLSLGWLLSSLITYFFWEGVMLLPNGQSSAPKILRYMIGLFIWVIVIAIMMKVVYGQSVVALLTASGFVAVVLGYAAQGTLGDIFSGVAVALAANIRQGHMVRVEGVDGAEGEVLEMDWRCLKVMNCCDQVVIVPHRKLAASVVTSHTLANKDLLAFASLSLPASNPASMILPVVDSAAHDAIIHKDWPMSDWLPRLSESRTDRFAVDCYSVLLYQPSGEYLFGVTKTHFFNIFYNKCRKLGIHGVAALPDESSEAASMSQEQLLAVLQKTEVLSALPVEALAAMAPLVTPEIFVTRERVMVQHECDTDLFVVASGEISLHETQGQHYKQTRLLSSCNDEQLHDIFGLKAFLFGEPRRVTARCSSKQACVLRIARGSFYPVLQQYPEVVDTLVDCLQARSSENQALFEGLSHDDQNQHSIKQVLKQKILELFRKPTDDE